jgi:hypothetical protein
MIWTVKNMTIEELQKLIDDDRRPLSAVQKSINRNRMKKYKQGKQDIENYKFLIGRSNRIK